MPAGKRISPSLKRWLPWHVIDSWSLRRPWTAKGPLSARAQWWPPRNRPASIQSRSEPCSIFTDLLAELFARTCSAVRITRILSVIYSNWRKLVRSFCCQQSRFQGPLALRWQMVQPLPAQLSGCKGLQAKFPTVVSPWVAGGDRTNHDWVLRVVGNKIRAPSPPPPQGWRAQAMSCWCWMVWVLRAWSAAVRRRCSALALMPRELAALRIEHPCSSVRRSAAACAAGS
jgi:hypothetical protein